MPILSVTMRKLWTDILCVLCLTCLMACSDGDDDSGGYIPPYITDLMMATTDADGKIQRVCLDDGTEYNVASQQISLSAKETKIRCMATYTHANHQPFQLHSIAPIFTDVPHPANSIRVMINGLVYQDVSLLPRDQMKVISMWKSGGYLNLHLGMMTTDNGMHEFLFCEDAPGQYSLLHSRPSSDGSAYTEHLYMSMPIPDGVDEFTFTVRTYDGDYTRTF